MASVAQ